MKITKSQLRKIIKEALLLELGSEEEEAERMMSRIRSEDEEEHAPPQEKDGFYPDMRPIMERKLKHYAVVDGEKISLNKYMYNVKRVARKSIEGMKKALKNTSFEHELPEWLQNMIIKFVKRNYVETY